MAAQQVGLLQPGQQDRQQHAGAHRREQHAQQGGLAADQEHVDVGAAQRGYRRTDRHQEEAGEDGGGQGARSAAHPGGHGAEDTGPAAALLEAVVRLHDEDDTGEAGVEVLHRHEPAALARVVDVDAA